MPGPTSAKGRRDGSQHGARKARLDYLLGSMGLPFPAEAMASMRLGPKTQNAQHHQSRKFSLPGLIASLRLGLAPSYIDMLKQNGPLPYTNGVFRPALVALQILTLSDP